MPAVVVVVYCAFAVVVATVWPLAVYSTSLALFGFAHVVSELRYVDARFGARMPRGFWIRCAIPLALIVLLRLLRMLDVVTGDTALIGEIALLSVLVGTALPLAFHHARFVGAVGVVVAAVFAFGSMTQPLTVLLILAVLHNATPLLFLVERSKNRARTWVVGVVVFFGVPALVASGLPTTLLVDAIDLDATLLPAKSVGALRDHYAVYLLPMFREEAIAAQLFSAAVTAQLLHYAAVIVWLPRSLTKQEQPTLPWPAPIVLVVVTASLSLGLIAHFCVDFAEARQVYGLAAAVHAWIELPVFIAGFALSQQKADAEGEGVHRDPDEQSLVA